MCRVGHSQRAGVDRLYGPGGVGGPFALSRSSFPTPLSACPASAASAVVVIAQELGESEMDSAREASPTARVSAPREFRPWLASQWVPPT